MRFEIGIMHALGAAIALFFAWQYYEGIKPETWITVEKWQVDPALETPLERGTALEAEHLVAIEIAFPEDRRSEFVWALDAEDSIRTALVGQRLTQTLQPGTFLERRYFFADTLRDFAARVSPGNRAFSIAVDGAGSLLNFVGPGSRVDVIGLMPGGPDDSPPVPVVILEDIEVMAVGPYDEVDEFDLEDAGTFRSVTFQAPPERIAHYLARAAEIEGDPVLVLRGSPQGGTE
ncbi:MAG: RcpC/CpaB family pilus assembly protein [Pseudomonadota bacterium]